MDTRRWTPLFLLLLAAAPSPGHPRLRGAGARRRALRPRIAVPGPRELPSLAPAGPPAPHHPHARPARPVDAGRADGALPPGLVPNPVGLFHRRLRARRVHLDAAAGGADLGDPPCGALRAQPPGPVPVGRGDARSPGALARPFLPRDLGRWEPLGAGLLAAAAYLVRPGAIPLLPAFALAALLKKDRAAFIKGLLAPVAVMGLWALWSRQGGGVQETSELANNYGGRLFATLPRVAGLNLLSMARAWGSTFLPPGAPGGALGLAGRGALLAGGGRGVERTEKTGRRRLLSGRQPRHAPGLALVVRPGSLAHAPAFPSMARRARPPSGSAPGSWARRWPCSSPPTGGCGSVRRSPPKRLPTPTPTPGSARTRPPRISSPGPSTPGTRVHGKGLRPPPAGGRGPELPGRRRPSKNRLPALGRTPGHRLQPARQRPCPRPGTPAENPGRPALLHARLRRERPDLPPDHAAAFRAREAANPFTNPSSGPSTMTRSRGSVPE